MKGETGAGGDFPALRRNRLLREVLLDQVVSWAWSVFLSQSGSAPGLWPRGACGALVGGKLAKHHTHPPHWPLQQTHSPGTCHVPGPGGQQEGRKASTKFTVWGRSGGGVNLDGQIKVQPAKSPTGGAQLVGA